MDTHSVPGSANGLRARSHAEARTQILTAISTHGGATRSELTRMLGLPKSTVNLLVSGLVADGLVMQVPSGGSGPGSGSGRPATRLITAKADSLVAAVDIGHRHARVAIATGPHSILDERAIEIDVDQHAVNTLDSVSELLRSAITRSGIQRKDIQAATAGIPCPVDTSTGMVSSSTAILADWVGLDLRHELRRRTGLEVAVDNDANLGALSEASYGSAHGYQDFVYLKASSGIGACLMLDGTAYRGASGSTGEIGHTQLDPKGPWCRCGNRGCLETVVSIDAVRRQLAPLGVDPLDHDEIHHPAALRILTESGRIVGQVLAGLFNVLDPQAVILGGDLSATGEAFIDGVRESIRRLALPRNDGSVPDVRAAGLGRRAELVGALAASLLRASDISVQHETAPRRSGVTTRA